MGSNFNLLLLKQFKNHTFFFVVFAFIYYFLKFFSLAFLKFLKFFSFFICINEMQGQFYQFYYLTQKNTLQLVSILAKQLDHTPRLTPLVFFPTPISVRPYPVRKSWQCL